jgi:hypothetical protein
MKFFLDFGFLVIIFSFSYCKYTPNISNVVYFGAKMAAALAPIKKPRVTTPVATRIITVHLGCPWSFWTMLF